MENFSSFNASAARAAREAALLVAAESSDSGDSDSERGAGGEEEEVEAGSSSSSSDDEGRSTRGRHRHRRSDHDSRQRKERKAEKERRDKKKKKSLAKEKEKKKKNMKKKKRKRSRSRSEQPQPPPRSTLRRAALDLPAPYPSYSPSPRDDLYYFVNCINRLRGSSSSSSSSSSFFNVHDVVAAVDDNIVQRKPFRPTSETAGSSSLNPAEAFVATVLLLLSSGNDEAAVARVSAFAEFHFLAPRDLSGAGTLAAARLESFKQFWESGAGLCWEGNCSGWRGWFEAGSLPLPPPLSVASTTAKPKPKTIAPEDAGLAAQIASKVDARVLELLPEGDATFPVRVAEQWAREEVQEAASATIKALRGPAAIEALAALSQEEADGDPRVASAFAPFASVRSALLLGDGGEGGGDVATDAMIKMLSALGAECEGGGGRRRQERRRRWCLASDERREFLSRVLSALVTSSSSPLAGDARVCWSALEIEAAEEERDGEKQRDWERARAKAKTLLSLRPDSSALWRAFALLQAESGELSLSLRVSSKLLESLLGESGGEVDKRTHALAAAVEAADAVLTFGNSKKKKKQFNHAAVLLVAAATGVAPSEVAIDAETGAPTAEARAKAAAARLDEGNDNDASSEAAAAAAAVEALLLLLPLDAEDAAGSIRALAEAEAAARLGEAIAAAATKNTNHHRRRAHPRFFEWVVLRRCRMLAASAAASPEAIDEARSAVLDALERFPESSELVDLLAELCPDPLQLVRDVVSRAPSPTAVLRAIEVSKELQQSAAASAGVIEHIVSSSSCSSISPSSSSSPQLWRALARLELAGSASPSRARRALLRGVEACPWSRDLYFDLVDPRAMKKTSDDDDDDGIIVVSSGERAQLLEAAADGGVLFRRDLYEVALGMAVAGF